MENGAIGCSLSHLRILENAQRNNYEHILILEDDIVFTNPSLFIQQFNKFINTHNDADVVLFAGNNVKPATEVDETCVLVNACQTTTGYLVFRHYYEKLIENFKTGIEQLIRYPYMHVEFALDQYWKRLQTDKWYLIIPLTVTQEVGYSDVEKRNINYHSAMLRLKK
jgi:glycosyl transferase family 25